MTEFDDEVGGLRTAPQQDVLASSGSVPARPTRRRILTVAGVGALAASGAWWWSGPRGGSPPDPGPKPLWTYRGSERQQPDLSDRPATAAVFTTTTSRILLDPATGAVRRQLGFRSAAHPTSTADASRMMCTGSVGLRPAPDRVDIIDLTGRAADRSLPLPPLPEGTRSGFELVACTGSTVLGRRAVARNGDFRAPEVTYLGLALDNGEVRWQFPHVGVAPLTLTEQPDRVIGTRGTDLVALDPTSGKQLWSRSAGLQPLVAAQDAGQLYVQPRDGGGVQAVSAADGATRWTVGPTSGESWRFVSAVAAAEAVYLLRDDGTVSRHAAADGATVWQSRLPFLLDYRSRALPTARALLVPGPTAAGVVALDPGSGRVRWHFADHAAGVDVWTVASDGERVFAGHDEVLYGLRPL